MKKIIALLIVLFLVPLTASAQDFCEGNFDYDDDQDGSDAVQFKEDFGRMSYDNPCPPDGPAPVPKIDQGGGGMGVPWPNPRFTANVDNNGDGDCNDVGEPCDGTVTDNLTGLIWLRDANCSVFNAPRTWYDALDIIIPQLEDGYCQLADGSSPGDWRLPNRVELESLLAMRSVMPALPTGHPFANVQSAFYWSSTTFRTLTLYAWYVDMNIGLVDLDHKDEIHYVWPVRGGH